MPERGPDDRTSPMAEGAPPAVPRNSDRYLVFSASLRNGSLNTTLAALAAATITANGGKVDFATMADSMPRRSTRTSSVTKVCRPGRLSCSVGSAWRPRSSSAPGVQRLDARRAQERHRLGLPLPAAAVQRDARPADVRLPVDGRRQPRAVGTAGAVRAPRRADLPGHVLPRPGARLVRRGGRIADAALQERFDTNIVNFMDLVEASQHYPCVKGAWVEYLGEHPQPVIDRVE